MPASTPCPLPEVDRALSPFVNPQKETRKVRSALTRYLAASLSHSKPNTTYSHLEFQCPIVNSRNDNKSSDSKTIRSEYLKALRERSKAQARHDRIQSVLLDLHEDHVAELPGQVDAQYDNDVTRSYVSLLRQRSRFSSLQVIQSSLDKLLLLNVNPAHGQSDPKSLVKKALGEQADLPVQRLELLTGYPDVDESMFRLKKQVLESKANMNRASSLRAEATKASQADGSLKQQVYALGCARDEIVDWVQNELAKLSEESEYWENASPLKQPGRDQPPPETVLSEYQIRTAYGQYTKSRASLLEALESIGRSATPCDTAPSDPSGLSQLEPESSVSTGAGLPITSMLPQLQSLATSLRNERALLLQAVYLQLQFSLAADKASDSLSRLSEESHLLPSGSKELIAWGKTVSQAEAATEQFVTGRLQESLQETNNITAISDLSSLQERVLRHV
ncbi:hypothetical protein BCR34DRAFT_371694 [Clohesyomyces aquaticus]|uniref:Uncharacterized protein n=1 Tax=Clohesyomyces aquaticus TaxID=1231657 RepID=A0A1Y1ZGS7_9PLEO|nr:hypothetical protein BCR34DRAFT_371694 [Clohesyomyces aquaticus]